MTSFLKLFEKKDIYIILLFYSLYYIVTLITAYPIFEDEAWYTSSAYNFSKGGWFISRLIGEGFPNFVFPLFESIVFKILGFSFFNARLTSFLFGLFSLIIFRSILKLLYIRDNIISIVLLIFIFSPGYFFTFHIARPESAAVFFSLVSILYFLKSRENGGNVTKNICLCSLFCGIAFLTHPYTFPIYIVFWFYYLMLSLRQINSLNLLYFSIIAILILLVFITNSYFVLKNNFQLIIDRTSANNSLLNNSVSFFINIFNRRMVSASGLFFIILPLISGLILWNNKTLRLISFAIIMYLIIASFILSSSHAGNHYILNYIGLFTIICIAILVNIYDKNIALLICIFYIMSYSILDIKKNHGNFNVLNNKINLLLKSTIPPGSKVYGDIRFWLMLPETNYTAINWNRYNKSINESVSESDWVLVCNRLDYNNITNFDNIIQLIKDNNILVDTVLNIPTKEYGDIMVYKVYK